jgi:hypothetical protein
MGVQGNFEIAGQHVGPMSTSHHKHKDSSCNVKVL